MDSEDLVGALLGVFAKSDRVSSANSCAARDCVPGRGTRGMATGENSRWRPSGVGRDPPTDQLGDTGGNAPCAGGAPTASAMRSMNESKREVPLTEMGRRSLPSAGCELDCCIFFCAMASFTTMASSTGFVAVAS